MPSKPYDCSTWADLMAAWRDTKNTLKMREGEERWYRGVCSATHNLIPSLLWRFDELEDGDLDRLEANFFFEFQARARELHERGLSDWDYLFFMRHHGVPTRILDWTDALGTAIYFALETVRPDEIPCIWVLNPYSLNEQTWELRDLIQPKYLGSIDDDFWDYGELVGAVEGEWLHDGPVAIYPLQISERMRAQRGWFTMFGNDRRPLEEQFPDAVARIDLHGGLIDEAREFLVMAGIRPYAAYPDLDHLGTEVVVSNASWVEAASARSSRAKSRRELRR